MWSITRAAFLAASFVAAVAAQSDRPSLTSDFLIPTPTATVPARVLDFIGCFSDAEPLENHGPGDFQTDGTCQQICLGLQKAVMAIIAGSDCWCGDIYPREDAKVDDGECDSPCNGFGEKKCGGADKWSVWQTGLVRGRLESQPMKNGSSSDVISTTQPAPVSTSVAATVRVTQPAATSDEASAGGPNKAGIAAGIVVGIVAIAAIIGGVVLFLKRRKRLAVEQEYQRNAAMKDFYGKPPGTGHSSLTDNRLDPEIMMRRQSNGSIADNQDFSRRVLQVRNPDA